MTGMDWGKLAAEFTRIEADMLHVEKTDLHGDDFYAEALRRVLADRLEELERSYISPAEHKRKVDDAEHGSRALAQQLNDQHAKDRAEWARQIEALRSSAWQEAAAALRRSVHNAPGRYRQEGVLLAASWLDPDDEKKTDKAQEPRL